MKLTEHDVSELMSYDLFELRVHRIGDLAPTVRQSFPACACIVHTHAWTTDAADGS